MMSISYPIGHIVIPIINGKISKMIIKVQAIKVNQREIIHLKWAKVKVLHEEGPESEGR